MEEHYHQPTHEEHLEAERKILQFKDFKGFRRLASVVGTSDASVAQRDDDIAKRYVINDVLGKGSFGEVRKAMHIKANVECAIKIIDVS